jgi:glycosyltransferase involved in cell wall biosynthesis
MYLLLFGCQRITDERKGFGLLAEALRLMKQHDEQLAKKIALVVVGGDADRVRSLVPFRMFSVNYVSDPKRMVQLYNAVDLYVTPSLQDNLPNTIMESMACGTPCIGFNVGGIPEMIDHRENGYVADYKDAGDFADGIMWALNADYDKLSQCARKKVLDTYSEETVARKYMEV